MIARSSQASYSIKFFYEQTLKRDWTLTGVPVPKRDKFLPVILSRNEVLAIAAKIRLLRHAACLSLIYACGLRLGEGCAVSLNIFPMPNP